MSGMTNTLLGSGGSDASGGMVVTASPASLAATSGSGNISTLNTEATVTGGSGGYSYLWAEIGGPSGIDIDGATKSRTSFKGLDMLVGELRQGYFSCTVTDSDDHVAVSNTVAVSIERT